MNARLSPLRQAAALAWREWIMLTRQKMTFTLLVLVPVMQVLLYGYAVRPQASEVRVTVAGPSADSALRVSEELAKHKGLKLIARQLAPGKAEAMVRQGRAEIAVELPDVKSFADPFAKGGPVRILADATDASLTAAAVPTIEAAYWREVVARSDMAESGLGIEAVLLYNPDQRGDWTFLPGLVGVIVMIGMTMLGSLTIARDRESGRAETLAMLPCPAWVMLLGKLLPWLITGSLQGGAVLLFAWLMFGLPLAPSAAALILLIPLLALAHLALGQLISLRASNQMEALQGAVAFYLPAMLLSGFLYPFKALPEWAQAIGNLFPLSHFIRAAQGATLRAESAGAVLVHGWPIALFSLAALMAAVLLQSRQRLVS